MLSPEIQNLLDQLGEEITRLRDGENEEIYEKCSEVDRGKNRRITRRSKKSNKRFKVR